MAYLVAFPCVRQTGRQTDSATALFALLAVRGAARLFEAGGTRLSRLFRIDARVNFQAVGARFEICFDAMRCEM